MKEKRTYYTELSYITGLIVLAIGTAFMERADFGMSMVVSPAYIIHLKVSKFAPFFSFGMASYVFQAFLLIILALTQRKFKRFYIFSFATAFIYGMILDTVISLIGLIQVSGILFRVIFYIVGLIVSSTGVAFLFHTYLPPEVYDLFVRETSLKWNIAIGKVKTAYDVNSCVLSIILSLIFFGAFVGIGWGTVVCALLNGFLIQKTGHILEKLFTFKNALPLKLK